MNALVLAAADAARGQHRREHKSLTAAAEKRLLVWIAERLPRAFNAATIWSDSALLTRGSLAPCAIKSGTLILSL